MLLWLRSKKIPNMEDEEISDFLHKGKNANNYVIEKIKKYYLNNKYCVFFSCCFTIM